MTTFVGLSILTYLRTKMNGTIPNKLARNPERVSAINNLWTIQEMLKDLRRIKLAYSKSGKPGLLNVVKRDRDLAEALGFPGLFDSADNVAKLLSGSHLVEMLKNKPVKLGLITSDCELIVTCFINGLDYSSKVAEYKYQDNSIELI